MKSLESIKWILVLILLPAVLKAQEVKERQAGDTSYRSTIKLTC